MHTDSSRVRYTDISVRSRDARRISSRRRRAIASGRAAFKGNIVTASKEPPLEVAYVHD